MVEVVVVVVVVVDEQINRSSQNCRPLNTLPLLFARFNRTIWQLEIICTDL